MGHHYHEDEREDRNRVLVGLPARLNDAKAALKGHEKMVENLRTLYAQRGILKDSVLLDQMGKLLRYEPGSHRSAAESALREKDQNCPACTGGDGHYCKAHDWHKGFRKS